MKENFTRRLVAFFFDYLIVQVLSLPLIITSGPIRSDGTYDFTPQTALGLPALWFLWFVIPEGLWGATLGKKLVGIRVRMKDGGRLGIQRALSRRLCDIVDFWLSSGLVAIISFFASRERQRLGDMAVGSVVVRKEEGLTSPHSQLRGANAPLRG